MLITKRFLLSFLELSQNPLKCFDVQKTRLETSKALVDSFVNNILRKKSFVFAHLQLSVVFRRLGQNQKFEYP